MKTTKVIRIASRCFLRIAVLAVTPYARAVVNDNFLSALTISSVPYTNSSSNADATRETDEPYHYGSTNAHSVWYVWTAPSSGPMQLNCLGSSIRTVVAVYTGATVGGLTPVASGRGNHLVNFIAVAGTTYRIALDSLDAGQFGNFTFRLSPGATPPANDAFASATLITGGSYALPSFSNIGATKESGEPIHAGNPGGKSLWWQWTAPTTGQYQLDTSGSFFDTLLAVYTGSAVGSLSLIASNDNLNGPITNSSLLTFSAMAGTIYHFAVDGWEGREGQGSLNLTPSVPPVTFSTSTYTLGNEDSGPDAGTAADVNGDGRLDLISANYGFRWANPGEPGGWNNTLTVLTNNGSGGFGRSATLPVGFGPSAVVAADVNGDGKADLISANETDNTVTVLTNNGSGLFGGSATFAVGVRPRGLVAADVNGDGALDLVSPNAGANTLTVLTNQGRGVFGMHATLPVGNEPLFVAAADVNGDGRPDLISANKNDDSLTVLTNNGSGGFAFNATLPVGHFPDAVSAADFNGDGKLDLVSVNWGAATMTVLTNNGGGGFGFNATLGVGSYPSTVAAADFNGDGAADLICASSGADSLTVLTNNGSGGFGYDTTIPVGRIPNVFFADLNSDGKLDLACPNFRDGTLTVLLNTTTFTPAGARPRLSIQRQGNTVRVAWPSATPGWSLQQKPDVSAVSWLPSGHEGFGFADDGNNKSLTLPAWNAGLFFRLLHP